MPGSDGGVHGYLTQTQESLIIIMSRIDPSFSSIVFLFLSYPCKKKKKNTKLYEAAMTDLLFVPHIETDDLPPQHSIHPQLWNELVPKKFYSREILIEPSSPGPDRP
jgi:hypothetical protein